MRNNISDTFSISVFVDMITVSHFNLVSAKGVGGAVHMDRACLIS